MSNIILKICEHSATSLSESDVWLNKRKQLGEWGEKFLARAKRRFENLHDELKTDLENAIFDFAEYHYEDELVNESRQRCWWSLNFDERYRALLKELAGECQRERKKLSDELRQEMEFIFYDNAATNLELEGTTTWGQYISTAVGLAGVLFPPLILAGILGNIFSDSKAEKIQAAKKKLREDLTAPSFEILDKMHAQALEIFNREILAKGVTEFYFSLAEYQFMLARLGKSQSDMAKALFEKFSDLNVKLFEDAFFSRVPVSFRFLKRVRRFLAEIFSLPPLVQKPK